MLKIHLYTRPNCHLCEDVSSTLSKLTEKYPLTVIEHNIEQDEAAHKQYLTEIPVIVVGPYTLRSPIDANRLEVAIRSALQGDEQDQRIKETATPKGLNRFGDWISRHWLAGMNLFFAGFLGGAFLPPILIRAGWNTTAEVIYKIYSVFCHQLAFRSFFLFGQQTVYPREAAHVANLLTFGQATGLSEMDLLGARAFFGNAMMGYKLAMCERDIAIYSGLLLFGLTFGLLRSKIRSLHVLGWIALGLLPIALDGGSQLLSQIRFFDRFINFRESTPLIRTSTGFMFGLATAWMGLPVIDESMKE